MEREYEGVITKKADDAPRVRGTRITIYDVMDYYTAGQSVAYTADVLRLSESDVRAAIAYIEAHKAQVTETYQRILARHAKGDPPEVKAKLAKSRERLLAWRAELEAKRAASTAAGERNATTPG
jgi:uncharacterized protein (DUF433 family)